MKLVLLLILILISLSAHAAPTCSKNGTRVIYTNGVTTTRDNADYALSLIKELKLDASIDLNPSLVRYRLATMRKASLKIL